MKSLLALSLVAVAAAAHAQNTGNPGGMSADTPGIESGRPKVDHSNAQDKLFVRQAALGGRTEVDLGKLAQSKAQAQEVRSFAGKMVTDHSQANERLSRIGRAINAEAPQGQDPDAASFRSELQKEQGASFDQRYLAKQVEDHQRTLNLLHWELSTGQNATLKDYAKEMIPKVTEHLRLAQAALANVTGAAPP